MQSKCLCSLLTPWLRILWFSLEIPKVLKKLVKSLDRATQWFVSLALCNLSSGMQEQKELVVKQGILCVLLFLLNFSDLKSWMLCIACNCSIAIECLNCSSFYPTIHLTCTMMTKDTLDGCNLSKPQWNSWACRWCHVMIMSSAIMPLVLLAIIPCNHFFSMGNQANLLLSHLLSTMEPSINLFSLVPVPQVSAGNFVLFGLKLLWLIFCFTFTCKHATEWFNIHLHY